MDDYVRVENLGPLPDDAEVVNLMRQVHPEDTVDPRIYHVGQANDFVPDSVFDLYDLR